MRFNHENINSISSFDAPLFEAQMNHINNTHSFKHQVQKIHLEAEKLQW